MAKTFPNVHDAHTTSAEYIQKCGCELLVEVEVHQNGNILITPTITYCRLHALGFEMVEIFKEEIGKRILDE